MNTLSAPTEDISDIYKHDAENEKNYVWFFELICRYEGLSSANSFIKLENIVIGGIGNSVYATHVGRLV